MAAPTNLLQTYHAGTQGVGLGNFEDLSEEIKVLKNADTILYDSLKKTKADAKKVEWTVKSLRQGQENAQIEGDDLNLVSLQTPVRVYNMIQEHAIPFGISEQQNAVNSIEANVASKTTEALELLKRDLEYTTLLGVRNDGTPTTPAKAGGIVNWIVTNLDKAAAATLNADGTVTGGTPRPLTVSILENAHQNCYSNGGNPEYLYIPTAQASVLASLTQTGNFRVNVEDGKVYNYVDVFKTPFGLLKVVIHRGLPASVVIGLDPKYVELPHLLPVRRKELPAKGLYMAFVVACDFTVKVHNEAAHFRITNLS